MNNIEIFFFFAFSLVFILLGLVILTFKKICILKRVIIKEREEKCQALRQLTAQLVHDIRSPNAALTMLIQNLDTLPNQHRLLMQRATQQITHVTDAFFIQHFDSKEIAKNPDINTIGNINSK